MRPPPCSKRTHLYFLVSGRSICFGFIFLEQRLDLNFTMSPCLTNSRCKFLRSTFKKQIKGSECIVTLALSVTVFHAPVDETGVRLVGVFIRSLHKSKTCQVIN